MAATDVAREAQTDVLGDQLTITRNGTALQREDYLDLAEIEVEMSIGKPCMATLRFRDTKRQGDETEDYLQSMGWNLTDEVVVTHAATSKKLFTGEVALLTFEFSETGRHAIVRAYDRSHRMFRGLKSRTFVQVKDSDVFRQVIADSGVTAGTVTSTPVNHVHLYQHNQSDYDFLRIRAEENGLLLMSDADGHLSFCEPPSGGAKPNLDGHVNLRGFRSRLSAPLYNKVTVRAWDPVNTKELTATQDVPDSAWAKLAKTPASATGKFTDNTRTKSITLDKPGLQQAEIDELAKSMAERESHSFAESEARVLGSPDLRPGTVVQISNMGTTFNGEWRISSARHVMSPQHGYETFLVFSGLNDRSALALSSGKSPARAMPKMVGLVTGMVSVTAKDGAGPPDPPSKSHVKVKFDWIKNDKGQPHETDWVQTVQLGATGKAGGMFVPEVNDEVLVGFEHGNIHKPYIIGGVYNQKNVANSKLDDKLVDGSGKITRRAIQSRTNHALVFEDANDKADGITLVTGDDNFTIVLNKKDSKITIDSKSGKVEIHGQQ